MEFENGSTGYSLLLKSLNFPAVETIWGMQWLFLKGLVESGQWIPAKNTFFILGVMCIKGFQLKRGKNLLSVMSVMTVTPRHNALLTQEEQISVSHQRANRGRGRGNVSFSKNSLKKQNKTQNIRVSYRQSPPLHHNSTLTLCSTFYFVFKLHFKKKVIFFLHNIS